MSMSNQTITRKATTGEPGNKGEFGSRTRAASDVTLTVSDTPTVPAWVDEGYREVDVFDFDGETLHVATDDKGDYQIWTPSNFEYLDDFDIDTEKRNVELPLEERTPPTATQVRAAAITVYAESRAAEVRELARRIPRAKERLLAEAQRIDGLVKAAPRLARAARPAKDKHPKLF